MTPNSEILSQLDDLLLQWTTLCQESKFHGYADLPGDEVMEVVARARTTLWRFTRDRDKYRDIAEEVCKGKHLDYKYVDQLMGVVRSLREDYAHGRLQTLEQLIIADAFEDFLEMAEYLLESSYKDPAAVLAGSVLEQHLRLLSENRSISVTKPNGKPEAASRLNQELAKAQSYGKSEQKSITAWLGIRNDAAHGNYSNYGQDQVRLLIAGVRAFMLRNPS
jgi:hypothetical protein